MLNPEQYVSRRGLMKGTLAFGAAMALFTPGVFAEHLDSTPACTEGPFYPYGKLPLDQDNDLIVVNGHATPALGTVSHVGGKILDANGEPMSDVLVEIWQCDAKGVYLAEGDARRDTNFQGYGKFVTASDGGYRFRTIKPVPYTGRPAPHIHIKMSKGGSELLTTQIFIAGFAGNARDGVFRGISDPFERELVSADFKPVKDSKIEELAAEINMVIGRTPADKEPDHH